MKIKKRLPIRHFEQLASYTTVLSLGVTASPALIAAAEAQDSPAKKERALISVLQSSAPQAEKAITCKKLAIYGSKVAVPALAPRLADADLASWARIALEAIPDPAADAALRDALDKLQGKLLVGTINSISVDVTTPPIIGVAMRFITSAPAP